MFCLGFLLFFFSISKFEDVFPIPGANTQEVLVHAPHHRPHDSCLRSGARALSLPRYQADEPECTDRRARIQEANAGWPGAEGPWAAGTALLLPLVGLGERVSGPLSDGSLALNKQFRSVAS